MADITKAQSAREDRILNAKINLRGKITTWREWIDGLATIETDETDGSHTFSRIKFNRMNYSEQAAYTAALKAMKFYWVNSIKVSKTVYDYAKNKLHT